MKEAETVLASVRNGKVPSGNGQQVSTLRELREEMRSKARWGHFPWCAPGDDQRDRWLLRFSDHDRRDCMFDNEAEAREAWERYCGISGNWNGYLFRLAASGGGD